MSPSKMRGLDPREVKQSAQECTVKSGEPELTLRASDSKSLAFPSAPRSASTSGLPTPTHRYPQTHAGAQQNRTLLPEPKSLRPAVRKRIGGQAHLADAPSLTTWGAQPGSQRCLSSPCVRDIPTLKPRCSEVALTSGIPALALHFHSPFPPPRCP